MQTKIHHINTKLGYKWEENTVKHSFPQQTIGSIYLHQQTPNQTLVIHSTSAVRGPQNRDLKDKEL